jgi:hypothetical protein
MRAESEGSGRVDYRVARMKPQDERWLVWVASDGSLERPAQSGAGATDSESTLALDLSTATQVLRGYGLLSSNPADPLVIDLSEAALPLSAAESLAEFGGEELETGDNGWQAH